MEAPRRPDLFIAAAGILCAGQVWAFAPLFLIRSERAGRPACWLSGSFLGPRRPGAGNEAQRRSWDTGL